MDTRVWGAGSHAWHRVGNLQRFLLPPLLFCDDSDPLCVTTPRPGPSAFESLPEVPPPKPHGVLKRLITSPFLF